MRLDPAEFEIFGVDALVRVETIETKEVVIGELDSKESETLNCLLQVGLSTEKLDDTITVKQESSQAQQLVVQPEPEPSTSENSGITVELRHKPKIDVLMSVHLDDENTAGILKELDVNLQI